METKKFMQVLAKNIFRKLEIEAKERGVTTQELIRTIIIPEWLKKEKEIE